jgi:hypothetical protein
MIKLKTLLIKCVPHYMNIAQKKSLCMKKSRYEIKVLSSMFLFLSIIYLGSETRIVSLNAAIANNTILGELVNVN